MRGGTRPCFRNFYSDLSVIGRYFVLYDQENPHIKRQYTIANAMIPDVKKSLLELIDTAIKGTLPPLPSHIFMDRQSQPGIWLTLKNYNSVKGVAT